MTDKLTNTALREELEKLKRYRAEIIAKDGRVAYEGRLTAICDEIFARGLVSKDEVMAELARTGRRCTLTPLADNVVVLPDREPDVTAGGIIKPDSAKAVPSQGEVLAVGPGSVQYFSEDPIGAETRTVTRHGYPLSVQVGDKVLFGKYSGLEFVLDGETVLIMPERDILGVLG